MGPVLSKAEYALEFFWAEISSFFKLHEIHSADRGDLAFPGSLGLSRGEDIPPATYSIIQNRRLVDSGILALNLVLKTQVGLLSDDSIKYGCQNISILKGLQPLSPQNNYMKPII